MQFCFFLTNLDDNFQPVNNWRSDEDLLLMGCIVTKNLPLNAINIPNRNLYNLMKRYNFLKKSHGSNDAEILNKCYKVVEISNNLDDMAFNNDHTSKRKQPWDMKEINFMKKCKFELKLTVDKMMQKRGLKGRSRTSINNESIFT
jgi:hypothetical protein